MFSRWGAHGKLGITCVVVAAIATAADPPAPANPADAAAVKAALQQLQEFIGQWNLEGSRKVDGRLETWKETVSWSWKFRGDAAWLAVEFAEGKGKYFTRGTVSYDPATKKYRVVLATPQKTELVAFGTVVRGQLKAESTDAAANVHRLTMTTLAEGVRFQFKYDVQEGGKGLFLNVFALNGNRAGESLAAGKKAPECIVSGGAATIPVTYQGKQYYVCCSGCRDEFYANPEKYIAAAAKK